MVFTTQMLMEQYRNYANPQAKIKRLVNEGELFPLTRGLYETDGSVPGYCLAEAIFGPSYLSFDYALSVYGLIPEAVYSFTSATFDKKKAKTVENRFGRYTYQDVPANAYPFGIVIKEENGYIYQMASPEKALCDKLYTMPPVTSQKDLERMLFEDLRIDRTEFDKLDADFIREIGAKYRCNNLKYLTKYLGRKPKKYQIKAPEKCKNCDRFAECEFQKVLYQKPFDATGILLACKAFYFVFCNLEEKCLIPFGDEEKMKTFRQEIEKNNRPHLTSAFITNGILAAELAFKALTLKETGSFDCIHYIDDLFYALPTIHQLALSSLLKEKTHQTDATLKINLTTIRNFYVEWRYFFQNDPIGYTGFLPEFIHIVCDYAIKAIER